MSDRTAASSNVLDITRRIRERAAAEPAPPTVEPAPVVALAQHQDTETAGRLLFAELWAEAEARFGGGFPAV